MKYPKYYWLNDKSESFLRKGYINPSSSGKDKVFKMAQAAEKYLFKDKGIGEKIEDYASRGWYSFSSPEWANFGESRGLPVSCNGSLILDDMKSILGKVSEIGYMTKHGSGTSAYFGELRPRGSKISDGGESSGPVHFMELFDCVSNVVSQSNVRRGSMAAYMPVEHPDFLEFLKIRSEGNPIQNLSIGAVITDDWMKSMISGDTKKRKIWAEIIKKRFESGYPYIFFTDTVNNNKPQCYKDKNVKIWASNLCSETCIPAGEDISFVCTLASMNLLHYDEWKNTDAVEVLTYFLDAVTEEYIQKTANMPFMEAANKFAREHRAIGLGELGWHSYLQSKMIAFESMEAKMLNTQIHKLLAERTLKASKELAEKYGEPEMLKGYGERMTTRMAIAPTTSSSFILGQVSPSIEPLDSNYFVKDLAKGKYTYKNPFLKELLHSKSKDDAETWKSILVHGGSVQHLDFLSEHEKNVFKTFGEISQKEIVIQAAQRQKYIDQSQSLNLMIPADTPAKDASQLMIFAWEQGVKTLYYQRSSNPAQELARNILQCRSCEA
ncbi:MAG: Vitamin B12-dependent ribonucleoside-diphosphate reductase [Ignavibacteriaceae bacterium]|nr:Vitamin B12-dependent ribonucleoside-diphosphate reductase [Ignavibacteriaceae bacterium]